MKEHKSLAVNSLIFRCKECGYSPKCMVLAIYQDGFSDNTGRYFNDVTVEMNDDEARKLYDFIGKHVLRLENIPTEITLQTAEEMEK